MMNLFIAPSARCSFDDKGHPRGEFLGGSPLGDSPPLGCCLHDEDDNDDEYENEGDNDDDDTDDEYGHGNEDEDEDDDQLLQWLRQR